MSSIATTEPPLQSEQLRLRSTRENELEVTQEVIPEEAPQIKWLPLFSILVQHFSSSWGERSYEFASYLYLIVLFPNSLIPASLLGFTVTVIGLAFSGRVGSLVDEHKRLPFVRRIITIQKILQLIAYGLFLALFRPLLSSIDGFGAPSPGSHSTRPAVYVILVLIIIASSILGLATAGINVALQRDWVVTISQGSHALLTKLNTYLRRVDLLCKLLAPLFVSLLTTTISYSGAVAFYLALAAVTLAAEQILVKVIWNHFGILAIEEKERHEKKKQQEVSSRDQQKRFMGFKEGLHQQGKDVKEFITLPVFLSSLSISLVYLTTLSFDGIMISYLKAERSFSDAFIAGMRGVAVVAGLVGTVAMPLLEKRLGLVRAGAWSLWSQILSLIPVVVSLYVGLGGHGSRGPGWNAVMLFGGMSLSRIGLWSFDLVQLQILQESLANHSRRNALTALQLSLQNMFDLTKYAIVLGLNKPSQFKWTALISWISVFIGGLVYSTYVYKMRGHLLHWQPLIFHSTRAEEDEQQDS
ncbi:hypothetical protein CPB86DRAFT_730384 [Serendipita vermifera]|nr:hypothetical protein CPB86DRAFT_730384 [Serendipita vermifera]